MKMGFRIAASAVLILGLTLVGVSCSYIGREIDNTQHALKKSEKVSRDIANKTLTAENAIYNYEWFKNQEASIQELYKKEETAQKALDDFVAMMPEDIKEWDRTDKTRHSILSDNLTGVTNMLDNAISDYDAKSSMVNKNIFKDLPTNMTRSYLDALKLTGGKQ